MIDIASLAIRGFSRLEGGRRHVGLAADEFNAVYARLEGACGSVAAGIVVPAKGVSTAQQEAEISGGIKRVVSVGRVGQDSVAERRDDHLSGYGRGPDEGGGSDPRQNSSERVVRVRARDDADVSVTRSGCRSGNERP